MKFERKEYPHTRFRRDSRPSLNGELDWMRRFATLQFMAEFRDSEGKMKLSDFPKMLERTNRLFEELTVNI